MYIRDIIINYKTNGFVLFYTFVQFPLITDLIVITYIFKPLTYFIILKFGIDFKYQNMIKSPVFSRSYKVHIT